MKIDIYTKNISLDKPLEVFIQEKIGSLEKFIKGGAIFAKVEIGKPSRRHKNGFIFRAEANLSIGGELLRAESDHEDLRTAITEVKDDLQIQIKKFKEKRKDLARLPKK